MLSLRHTNDLAHSILPEANADSGTRVELMQKQHKLAVVAELQRRGFFMLREAVDLAASALRICRYTVYNYINELDASNRLAESASATPGG
jgi:predicted transcriptional regulator YheO